MMTNKLYELEKQARDYADLVPGSMYEKRIWTNHFQSKYAELIINECINQCFSDDYKRIANHFGIAIEEE